MPFLSLITSFSAMAQYVCTSLSFLRFSDDVYPVLEVNWILYLILSKSSTDKTIYGQVHPIFVQGFFDIELICFLCSVYMFVLFSCRIICSADEILSMAVSRWSHYPLLSLWRQICQSVILHFSKSGSHLRCGTGAYLYWSLNIDKTVT